MRPLLLGKFGENRAVRYLQQEGFEILRRNYRTPFGEIDIIAREEETLVFVEVKTRSTNTFGMPQEAVNRRKQRQLIRTAQAYLNEAGGELPPCRFDVIAVRTDGHGQIGKFELIRGAFDAPDS
ncbi:MAG: YraN family protein [Deltaproteobacteria bacterium]|nr:YraN family protein [Deltaproteobacteria bacterium]